MSKKKAMFFNTQGSLYDDVYVAFSLRQIIGSGDVVRVRDSGDDSEADYSAAEVAAGLTAIGSDNGFLVKMYDQVGTDGRGDLVQSSTSLQPKILNSGSLYTNNGKPYINFDNTDLYLTSENAASGFMNPSNTFTIYMVFKSQGVSAQDGVFEEVVLSNVTRRVCMFSDTTSNAYNTGVANDGALNVLNNSAALSQNTVYLETYKRTTSGSSDCYLDGVFQENHGWDKVFPSNTNWRLGKRSAGNARFAGEFAEILIFNEAHGDTTREAIESDIMTYYGI